MTNMLLRMQRARRMPRRTGLQLLLLTRNAKARRARTMTGMCLVPLLDANPAREDAEISISGLPPAPVVKKEEPLGAITETQAVTVAPPEDATMPTADAVVKQEQTQVKEETIVTTEVEAEAKGALLVLEEEEEIIAAAPDNKPLQSVDADIPSSPAAQDSGVPGASIPLPVHHLHAIVPMQQ